MAESNKSGGSAKRPVTKSAGENTGSNKKAGHGFKKPAIHQTKFEGKCDELKGHIYDCSDSRQADMYAKTMKEIAEYVGHTYKYGSDASLAIKNLQPQAIPMPADPPTPATHTQTRVWEKNKLQIGLVLDHI